MIPAFKDYFYPYMLLMSDNNLHHIREIRKSIGDYFKFSSTELSAKTVGGRVRHSEWCSWATTYLKKFGLISSPERFMYQVTDFGLKKFNEEGVAFSLNTIRSLKEFENFQKSKKGYWVPSHYTSSGKFVAGYMSQWEWKQKQRRFTKEQLEEFQRNRKNVKK